MSNSATENILIQLINTSAYPSALEGMGCGIASVNSTLYIYSTKAHTVKQCGGMATGNGRVAGAMYGNKMVQCL